MKISIKFPCKVQQFGPNEIVIEAKPFNGPIFAEGSIETIAAELSADEQDKLADDCASFLISEAIKRSLIVRPIHTFAKENS